MGSIKQQDQAHILLVREFLYNIHSNEAVMFRDYNVNAMGDINYPLSPNRLSPPESPPEKWCYF